MRTRSIPVLLFCCLVAVLARPSIGAGNATGEVVSIEKGVVELVDADGRRHALRTGSRVPFGARLRTGARAVAVISMPGQGRFVIGPETEMTLGEDVRAAEGRVLRGAVWMGARLGAGRTYRISTPVAVAGVRGTMFSVLSDSAGAAICTCVGEVSVTLGDSRVLSSRTGEFVPIPADGEAPRRAMGDRHLLRRPVGDRYDWCFTCHEVGGRGRLRRDW